MENLVSRLDNFRPEVILLILGAIFLLIGIIASLVISFIYILLKKVDTREGGVTSHTYLSLLKASTNVRLDYLTDKEILLRLNTETDPLLLEAIKKEAVERKLVYDIKKEEI